MNEWQVTMIFETDFTKLYEELNDINSSIEYRPISDIELFKQYANEIFGG